MADPCCAGLSLRQAGYWQGVQNAELQQDSLTSRIKSTVLSNLEDERRRPTFEESRCGHSQFQFQAARLIFSTAQDINDRTASSSKNRLLPDITVKSGPTKLAKHGLGFILQIFDGDLHISGAKDWGHFSDTQASKRHAATIGVIILNCEQAQEEIGVAHFSTFIYHQFRNSLFTVWRVR
ncbi:hypothetical protein V2G26_005908 [Clonostachys chloroleuca]